MAKKSGNFGARAIARIYNLKLLIRGSKYPLIITMVILFAYVVWGEIDDNVITFVLDLIVSIIPSLLGFVLSGYALLIGFGNIKIIAKKKNSKNGDQKPTLYQKVSSVFAISLIMQIGLLVVAFILKIIMKIDFPCICSSLIVCDIVNQITFAFLVFGLLYVTVMIKDLVINIFNFSQLQHFDINKPDINSEDQG